jgi:hypothetical protein
MLSGTGLRTQCCKAIGIDKEEVVCNIQCKGKAFPLQAWMGPRGFLTVEVPTLYKHYINLNSLHHVQLSIVYEENLDTENLQAP